MQEIEKAKRMYVKCKEEKCNCYSSVIDADLRKFGMGISKHLIDVVKSKYKNFLIVVSDANCLTF